MLTLKEIRDKYQTPHYDAKKMNYWAARNVYSRLATPIIWLLLLTPVTANQVTVGWVLLGIFSCCLFIFGEYWISIIAALLIQFHIVLDYVDGPIARIRTEPKVNSTRGPYIERVGHDLIYTIYFYCISLGAIKKGIEPTFILTMGFLASLGYFFYKYTRRAKIFCALIYNADKNDISSTEAYRASNSQRVGRSKNLVKRFFRKVQPIWDPVFFTIITLLATLFDLVHTLPIFYGLTFPIFFVISYFHQAKLKDDWVYEWVKNAR